MLVLTIHNGDSLTLETTAGPVTIHPTARGKRTRLAIEAPAAVEITRANAKKKDPRTCRTDTDDKPAAA